jgi:hypothetical protein
MTTKTLDFNNIQQKVFWMLSSLLTVMLAFYLYSVLSLTVAVVDRNSMETAAHQLANKVGDLEAQYLAQTNSVTLAYAESLGFAEVNARFARSTPVAAQSLAFAR